MTPHVSGPLLRRTHLGIEIHADWNALCGWYQIVEVSIDDPAQRRDIDVAEDLHEACRVAREYIEELMQ